MYYYNKVISTTTFSLFWLDALSFVHTKAFPLVVFSLFFWGPFLRWDKHNNNITFAKLSKIYFLNVNSKNMLVRIMNLFQHKLGL